MARQKVFEGMQENNDPEIAKLGAVFAKEGSKHKKSGEKKKAACDALVAAMLRKKITRYRDLEADPPISIDLSDPRYTVKIRTIDQPEEPGSGATQAPAKA